MSRTQTALHLASTTSLAFLFGSTAWAGVAVMPSLIAAPVPTFAKLAVFKGLIARANAVLPGALLGAVASLGYLTYAAAQAGGALATLGTARGYGVALAATVATLGLQVPVRPLNEEIVRAVDEGRWRTDDGQEGARRIAEVWWWNWGRVVLAGAGLASVVAAPALEGGN